MDKTDGYRHNEYGTPSKTIRGEVVKSHGEKQIADYFYANRIKYLYEDQAKTTKSAFRNGISKPDFYLLEHEVYVEYWGMIDVGDTEQRTKYRGEMKWKMRQYYDNAIRFISIYPWHLNDLDGAFRAQYKKVMKRDLIAGPVGEKSVYALPISPEFKKTLQFRVPPKIELASLELQYIPHYFVEYDCFTQGTVSYQRINLSSHGTIVIDGQKGSIVDMTVQSGVFPAIARSGHFVDCGNIAQKEKPRSEVAPDVTFSRIEAAQLRITKDDSVHTTVVEVARNLSQTYTLSDRKGRVETKTIRPSTNEIRIVSSRLVNIPIVTAVFGYKDRVYRRIVQAATDRTIADSLSYCNVERNSHFAELIVLCEDCGALACKNHGRRCIVCDKGLCLKHAVGKGLLMKKYYCSIHVPVQAK